VSTDSRGNITNDPNHPDDPIPTSALTR